MGEVAAAVWPQEEDRSRSIGVEAPPLEPALRLQEPPKDQFRTLEGRARRECDPYLPELIPSGGLINAAPGVPTSPSAESARFVYSTAGVSATGGLVSIVSGSAGVTETIDTKTGSTRVTVFASGFVGAGAAMAASPGAYGEVGWSNSAPPLGRSLSTTDEVLVLTPVGNFTTGFDTSGNVQGRAGSVSTPGMAAGVVIGKEIKGSITFTVPDLATPIMTMIP